MPNKRKKLKCYIYTRVSTLNQVDGYSLDAQRGRLIKEAEHREMDVVREFSDEGKSGKSVAGRPAFTEMLRRIESGNPDGVDYVLVFKLSRFGRSAADTLSCLQLLQDNSVELLCIEDGIDSASAASRVLLAVLAGIAEMERSNIIVQTKAGRQQKAREGGWNGGQAPLGYRIARDEKGRNGYLEVEPEEAELVKLVFEKFVHSAMGYSGIAKWLNANGYRRPVRQNGKYAQFTSASVKNILDNPVYTGRIPYGRYGKAKVKGKRDVYRTVVNEEYDLFDGRHDAIIPEEIWEKARAKRKATGGKPLDHHGPKYTHVLSGLLRCPECGSPMYGRLYRQKTRDGSGYYPDSYYYSCQNAKIATGKPCGYKTFIREEPLDEEVFAIAQIAYDSIEFNEDVISALGRPEDLDVLAKGLADLLGEKRKQEQKKSRLLAKIMDLDPDNDQYDAMYADLQGILQRIDESVSDLDERIEEARGRIRNAEEGAASAEQMLEIYRSYAREIARMPVEAQRDVMHAMFAWIKILPEPRPDGRRVRRVRFRFPISLNGMPGKYEFDMYGERYDDDEDPSGDNPPSGGGGLPPDGSPAGGGSGARPQEENPASVPSIEVDLRTEPHLPKNSIGLAIVRLRQDAVLTYCI